jgi:hypothetical protein
MFPTPGFRHVSPHDPVAPVFPLSFSWWADSARSIFFFSPFFDLLFPSSVQQLAIFRGLVPFVTMSGVLVPTPV